MFEVNKEIKFATKVGKAYVVTKPDLSTQDYRSISPTLGFGFLPVNLNLYPTFLVLKINYHGTNRYRAKLFEGHL